MKVDDKIKQQTKNNGDPKELEKQINDAIELTSYIYDKIACLYVQIVYQRNFF